jgi:hypothetical protein
MAALTPNIIVGSTATAPTLITSYSETLSGIAITTPITVGTVIAPALIPISSYLLAGTSQFTPKRLLCTSTGVWTPIQ